MIVVQVKACCAAPAYAAFADTVNHRRRRRRRAAAAAAAAVRLRCCCCFTIRDASRSTMTWYNRLFFVCVFWNVRRSEYRHSSSSSSSIGGGDSGGGGTAAAARAATGEAEIYV